MSIIELHDRIKVLRKEYLKMSQEKFAESLGTTRSVIVNIEMNKLARPEQKDPLIKLICKEFGVSETWLRTGKGEMKKNFSVEQETYGRFGKMMENGSPEKKNMIQMLLKIVDTLPDDQWTYIYEEFKACIERTEKEKENED